MFAQEAVYSRVESSDERLDPSSALGKIASNIISGQRVLDVGCGAGRLGKHLTELGARVTGIERNPQAAALARQYCAEVVELDLDRPDELNLRDTFDVIILADVLEHLVYPDKLLANLVRNLAPGGKVLVSLPNIAHYSIRLQLLRGEFKYQPYGILDRSHLRFFTRESAAELLREIGLCIHKVEGVYQVPVGRLSRYWQSMHDDVGRIAPNLFAMQWVITATSFAPVEASSNRSSQ